MFTVGELLPTEIASEFAKLGKRLTRFLQAAHDDTGALLTAVPTSVSDLGMPVGAIVPYAGATAPSGWLLCDGSAVSRETYRALFTAIGTTYGTGDGATTFNVPDLRGRFPLGKATSGTGSTLGGTGGAIDHVHTGPSHTHTSSTVNVTVSGAQPVATSPTNASGTGNTGTANPPFLAINFLVLYA